MCVHVVVPVIFFLLFSKLMHFFFRVMPSKSNVDCTEMC